jgi:hypothetical protein
MKASDFDKKFDDGREDVVDDIDPTSWARPNRDVKRVSVDLPLWMVEALNDEAKRLAVTRQSLIKVWLADRIDEMWRAMGAGDTTKDTQTR